MENGLGLDFLNKNYLITNCFSNFRSDAVHMHKQGDYKGNLLIRTCPQIFRNEEIQNFI